MREFFFKQRQDRDLDRRELGMKVQHHALLALHLFLVVGVDEKRQRAAVGAGRRLDDEGNHLLLALLVEVFERLAAELGMLLQIEIGAVGDPFELAPTHRKQILDVGGALGVVRQLVFLMLAQAQVFLANAVFADTRRSARRASAGASLRRCPA